MSIFSLQPFQQLGAELRHPHQLFTNHHLAYRSQITLGSIIMINHLSYISPILALRLRTLVLGQFYSNYQSIEKNSISMLVRALIWGKGLQIL